jgi:hypothetical protein
MCWTVDMSTGELIAVIALVASIIGVVLLYLQIKQGSDAAKATLLLSINRDLNSYADAAILIEAGKGDDWFKPLDLHQKERILDYISYFEGIQLALERRLFTIREVNAFFAHRFLRVSGNPSLRKHLFADEHGYEEAFRPILALDATLRAYRERLISPPRGP